MCNCILFKYGLGLGYKNTCGCSVRILLKKTPVYVFYDPATSFDIASFGRLALRVCSGLYLCSDEKSRSFRSLCSAVPGNLQITKLVNFQNMIGTV